MLGKVRGFGHAGFAHAVEFEKQRGLDGQVEMRVAVDGVDEAVVHELDAGEGKADLDALADGLDSSGNSGEGAEGDAGGLRQRVEAERDFSDDAEGAFRADEEASQVVTGAGFAGARAGVDDAAVGEDDGEGEDVFAHGAVTDGSGSGGAGGGHAAQGGVGAGVDEEGDAAGLERGSQLGAGNAGFDGGIHVVDADAEDAVHAGHVDGDAAAGGVDVALERRARAKRDDGEAELGADGGDAADLVGGVGEADEVRKAGRVGAFAVTVMLTDGESGVTRLPRMVCSWASAESIAEGTALAGSLMNDGMISRRCCRIVIRA